MATPKMKCLAVDDEPLALKIIEDFVQKVPYLELVGTSSSAIEAGERLKREPVDLLFLDINMPHLTGVDFLRMSENLPLVILTTAYPDYALTGYELNVVDYLLKPFSFDRFYKAATKAHDLFELRQASSSGGTAEAEPPQPQYLMVRVEYSTVRIDINDILLVEGLKDYVKIVTDAKNYVTKSSMKNVEEKLPSDRFKRVHKSFIVQLDKVQAFENNHLVIGDHRIPLGNNNREEFLKFLEKNRL
jgi:DNA-binding LytR/AlgR family response regulator